MSTDGGRPLHHLPQAGLDASKVVRLADPSPVVEDSGAHTVAAFATGMSAGPADESAQSLAFGVTGTTVDATLTFTAAPAIDASTGELTYTLAPNAWGTGTFRVTLSDDGSSGAPHQNVSAPLKLQAALFTSQILRKPAPLGGV